MKNDFSSSLRRLNELHSQTDAVYHEMSLKLGLSDSAISILYILCEQGDPCPLKTVYRCAFSSNGRSGAFLRCISQCA